MEGTNCPCPTAPGGPDACRDHLLRACPRPVWASPAITAYRKRFLAAARIAAYALLPVGLVMTGVVDWLADTGLQPDRLGGLRRARARLAAVHDDAGRWSAAAAAPARTAHGGPPRSGTGRVAPAASAARPGAGRGAPGAKAAGKPKPAARAAPEQNDFSDIEAILKKHGI